MANASDYVSVDSSLSYDYVYEYSYSTAWVATVPLILSVIIVVTTVGNFLVVLAYFRDQRIQANVSNILILNLAVTDFIVGALIMTFNLQWLIKDYWIFGEIFCKLWLVLDYTVTVMSVVVMLLISWDRYCLVSMGMKYKSYQTKKRIVITLLICWAIMITVYAFMAFAWSAMTGEYNVDYSEDCEMDYSSNLAATVVFNIFEFFIPFTLLIILNMAVYLNIKRRSSGTVGQSPQTNKVINDTRSSVRDENPTNSSTRRSNYLHSVDSTSFHHGNVTLSPNCTENEIDGNHGHRRMGSTRNNGDPSNNTKRERKVFARHRKAALVLAVLVGCFLLCWLPYQVSSVMFAICGTDCVSINTWEVTNYLLWCNSTINPFIYAATNVHFRRNFRHFLLLDRWTCDIRRCKCKRQEVNPNAVFHDTVNDSVNS